MLSHEKTDKSFVSIDEYYDAQALFTTPWIKRLGNQGPDSQNISRQT